MPWPRITGDHFASSDTSKPPTTAAMTTEGERCRVLNRGDVHPNWWNNARLVMSPMSLSRTHAAPPAPSPTTAASAVTRSSRLELRVAGTCQKYRVTRYSPIVLADRDYRTLAQFRHALRVFLRFSED